MSVLRDHRGQATVGPRATRRLRASFVLLVAPVFLGENSGNQAFFVMVSETADVAGLFYKYTFNVNVTGTDDFDYDIIGYNKDALIVTANIYPYPDNPEVEEPAKWGEVLTIPTTQLYSGSGATMTIFYGFPPRMTPPIVLDNNATAYIVVPPEHQLTSPQSPPVSVLNVSAAQGLATAPTLTYLGDISVPPYVFPGDAHECTSPNTLDTEDERFVNASTQYGTSLWQTHTTGFDTSFNSRPTPRWYEINTATRTLAQTGQFFATSTSSDWNASIAANESREAFVTWNRVQTAPTCVRPEIRHSGRQPTDTPGVISSGNVLSSSNVDFFFSSPGTAIQWGDFSTTALDPSTYSTTCGPRRRAWIVNQKVYDNQAASWATVFGGVGFC